IRVSKKSERNGGVVRYQQYDEKHQATMDSWVEHGVRIGDNPAEYISTVEKELEEKKNGGSGSSSGSPTVSTTADKVVATGAQVLKQAAGATPDSRGSMTKSPWFFATVAVLLLLIGVGSLKSEWLLSAVLLFGGIGILTVVLMALYGGFKAGDVEYVMSSDATFPYVVALGLGETADVGRADLQMAADGGDPIYVGICGNTQLPNGTNRISIREGQGNWMRVVRRDMYGNQMSGPVVDIPSGKITTLDHNPSGKWAGEQRIQLRNTYGPTNTFVVGTATDIIGACSTFTGNANVLTNRVDMLARCASGAAPGPGIDPSECPRYW
ncbi:MAG: hypothetical protein KJ749_01450, partial [Planctomycetes bacterium]|nr:hypothetical protein [Planctomycetota bacterium]